MVRVEDTIPGDGTVPSIRAAVPPARRCVLREAMSPLAPRCSLPGTRLGPAHLGMLASLGVARPAGSATATGGDPVDRGRDRAAGDGGCSARARSAIPIGSCCAGSSRNSAPSSSTTGSSATTPVALNRVLGHAAANADIVLTSGGVSMGDYDLVKQELGKLGTVEFWKVAMQPAKPFAFGIARRTRPLFGLPGNPVSVFVAFEQFVRPALLQMMGADGLVPTARRRRARARRVDRPGKDRVPAGRRRLGRRRRVARPVGGWTVVQRAVGARRRQCVRRRTSRRSATSRPAAPSSSRCSATRRPAHTRRCSVDEGLTHLDEHGDARMVDVGQKAVTARTAVAEAHVSMSP